MPKKTQPKKSRRKTSPRGRPLEDARSAGASKCQAVVGLGASAGGLEAFKKFFQSMPPDSGMAFVLIPHLDPHHESFLAELLSRDMRMPVLQVQRRVRVEPNNVYVMPPNALLRIQRGALVAEAPASETPRMPIDRFFRSLAEDQGENAIGIVLSGMGSDGSVGLMAIKEHGGIAMAQATSSARYDGMPRSAITTGIVDHVLPVEEMPKRLLEYVQHLDQLARRKRPDGLLEDAESNLTRIVQLLRQRTGHDFGQYKRSTLLRRIQRRMQVVQAGTAGQYLDRLHKEKRELELLFKDLLIGVTNFFRDTDAFASLAAKVIPLILAKKGVEPQVRVWVPACSTGEEAYSIAILMAERAAKLRNPPRVQVFATDIDEQALEVARLGVYPESIAEQVSPARLERFFSREGQHFKVKKALRDLLIFSRHNVTRDPPFSRLDLLCCRNLFIYLESELQKRLIHLYHYALGPGGYLFLGSSENMVGPPGLFLTLDKKHRIFQRKALMLPSPAAFPLNGVSALATRGPSAAPARREGHFGTTLEHVLAVQFAPPSVVVDERGDVVYYCGNTGKFLEHATGAPTSNVVNLAHRGLRLELRSALARAVKTKRQVRVEDLSVDGDGAGPRAHLIVRPLRELGGEAGMFLVVFQEVARPSKRARPERRVSADSLAEELEGELRTTKEHLHTTIEELETSNEALKSSNEELLSMNEELQSANEELQTSKEELQSVNEELETVNAELGGKVEELDSVNSDLQNLLQSTQIPTLFLDNELHISRFTAAATEVFRLIDSDVGRPIGDITSRLLDAELEREIRQVLRTLATHEREVRLAERDGWFLMRISPYRTIDHVIKGVVITFVDVSELERSRAQAAQLAAIVCSTTDAVFTEDLDGRITSWNGGAERMFGWSAEEAIGRNVSLLSPPELQDQAREIIALLGRGEVVVDMETLRLCKDARRIDVSLSCSPIHDARGELAFVSVIARDITQRKKSERELQRANETLRQSNEDLKHLAYAASHDLQEPLRMIANYARLLSDSYGDVLDEKGRLFVSQMDHGARRMDGLLRALRNYWSVERIEGEAVAVDVNLTLESAQRDLAQAIAESGAEITHDLLPTVLAQETPLLEVFQNLLSNAIKYRREGVAPRIHVGAQRAGEGAWQFSVADNGMGIAPRHLERVFQPFKRLHGDKIPGAGMGLAICTRIVKHFGGRLWIESNGTGSTFRFTLQEEHP